MALETLRYGSFKPTAVVTEAKSLPGYGGDVQDWTNYKFAVEAIQKKESMLSKEQQEKLGPLGLRLAERLIGPALQVAKKIGIDELSGKDGTKTLLRELEKQLLPLRKQAALELYNAGMRDGVLSRQSGEPMSSYCLRRETWWTMLRDMDPGIQCSDTILGEQLLGHSGLGQLEMQMVRTGCGNDLSQLDKLANTLRDQFGSYHERENRGGKGRYQFRPDKKWFNSGRSYLTDSTSYDGNYDGSEYHTDDTSGWTGQTEEEYGYQESQEDYYEVTSLADDEKEREIEEDVIAWYAGQSVDAQVCSPEDLEMFIEAVEATTPGTKPKREGSRRQLQEPTRPTV